jgi:nucleoside-diphosphate-sugar epimerase
MQLFCFGLGYTARTLIDHLPPTWQVMGTNRLGSNNLIRFDPPHLLNNEDKAVLAGSSHILISIPPSSEGDPVYHHHLADIQRSKYVRWVGVLSATSVYGDHGGAWVDEQSPCLPTNTRGQMRLQTEQAWLSSNLPVHIFRLAGIYGMGRNILDEVRLGTARRLYKEGQYFSKIHVDDLARGLLASMKNPKPNSIYNLGDNEPAPSHIVTEYACGLLGVEPPPLVPWDSVPLSEMGRSFWLDNKRVDSRRIQQELGITWMYPSYREGLTALLKNP